MVQTPVETNFLYMYGVVPACECNKSEIPTVVGIDEKEVFILNFKELAIVLTPVSPQNYSQQQLDLQLKDAEWLKGKAFHHHECIAAIHQHFTILPMSFCTIFEQEQNLKSLMENQYDLILRKLNTLKGKQEWNLKVYCNSEKAKDYILNHNPMVMKLQKDIETMPKGKQFIMKKKLHQIITSELEREQSQWWGEMKQQLKPYISNSILRRNWGREVTERTDDMVVNCDVLLEKVNTDAFLNKVQEIEESFASFGCTFHITGPWPPYHFSKIEEEIQ